jgi:cytochrome c-type biogenesis protein CcmH
MTAFVIIAALMVAFGLAWLLPPLLRKGTRKPVDRAAINLRILKDQLAELEIERTRGAIADEQYAATKADLQKRVLEETRAEPAAAAPRVSRVGKATAVTVACVVPLAAALTYARFGDPTAFDPLVRKGPEAAHQFSQDDLNAMTRRLAERLEKEPDNAGGWSTLARTYYQMGRFADAAAAFEKLVELVPDEASLWADYADALAMTQGRKIAGRPMELVTRALQLDPLQWKALAMAGTEAFDRQDYKSAAALWEKLQNSLPPDAPLKNQLAGSINEARSRAGMPPLAAASPPAKPSQAAKAAPAVPTERPADAVAAGARVSGTVSLADLLRDKVAPDDTVFIFARAAQGPRMPLALLRVAVKDLPKAFALDDTMAVAPQFKLSNFSEVVVGARVSKSGNAMPQSGDLQGESKPVQLGGSGIAVTIDSVVR